MDILSIDEHHSSSNGSWSKIIVSDSTILGTPTYTVCSGGSSQDGCLTLMFLTSKNVHSVILNALFFVAKKGSIHRTSFLRGLNSINY